jgi:hypothetical protein
MRKTWLFHALHLGFFLVESEVATANFQAGGKRWRLGEILDMNQCKCSTVFLIQMAKYLDRALAFQDSKMTSSSHNHMFGRKNRAKSTQAWGAVKSFVMDSQLVRLRFKKQIFTQIQRLEEHGTTEDVGESKWVGDNRPDFHFVSLAASIVGVTDQVYESIFLDCASMYKLALKRWSFIKDLRKTTGVKTMVGKMGGHDIEQEIGFFGTKQGIEEAKAAIKARAVDPDIPRYIGN